MDPDFCNRLCGSDLAACSVPAFAGQAAAESSASAEKPGYNRDIRRLSENCFACRAGKTSAKGSCAWMCVKRRSRKTRSFPANQTESELVKRIYTTNADDAMPPPELHKTLTPHQKNCSIVGLPKARNTSRTGLHQTGSTRGAGNKEPAVGAESHRRFCSPTLEEKGLPPSSESNQRTLLRRLSLDLIGLPPTPREEAALSQRSGSELTNARWTVCSNRRTSASAWRCRGWTWCGSRTRWLSRRPEPAHLSLPRLRD